MRTKSQTKTISYIRRQPVDTHPLGLRACGIRLKVTIVLVLTLWLPQGRVFGATFVPDKEEQSLTSQIDAATSQYLRSLPQKFDELGRAYIEIDDMIFVVRDGNSVDSAFTGNRWTNGLVYYVFDSNVTASNRQDWRDAAATWSASAAVSFSEGTGNGNYIYVQNGTANNSRVGMVGGIQIMNIINWDYRYIIAHEIGHALGLIHEQQRSDRDSYVTINSAYIQSGSEGNFSVASSTNYGGYDFDSVMHYDKCAFSTDCPAGSTCACTHYTISVNSPYTSQWQNLIGQRDHLSSLDETGMAQRYGNVVITGAELLTNGNFESQGAGWTMNQNASIGTGYPHAGSYYAYLGNTDNAFGNVFTTDFIPVPATATSATLSFWLNITSQETDNVAYDTMNVTLLFASGGSVKLTTYSNLNQDSGAGNPYYSQHIFDLKPYRGQSVRIYFDATTDSSLPTTFRIDDVSLKATLPTSIPIPNGAVIGLVANANGMVVTAENAGKNPLIANRSAIGQWEQFQVLDQGNGYVALRSLADGLYVTAENAGASALIANRGSVGTWEQFQLVDAGGGKFAMIARADGLYVTAENGGSSSLIANRKAIGDWEKFSMVFLASGVPGNVTLGLQSLYPISNAYVSAESAGSAALVANRSQEGSWEQFRIEPQSNGNVAIRSLINGLFVTAENAGASALIANRNTVGTWEQFQLFDAGNGTVALRALANGLYVSAANTGNQLIANRFFVGSGEQFKLMISLRALANNKIVTAENAGAQSLIANRDAIGTWEQFQFISSNSVNNVSPGYFALKANANGMYVTAENAGNNPLIANRGAIGTWEQFQWVIGGNGNVVIKALANGLFVTAENAGASPLIANRSSAGTWEQFH